MHKAGRKFFTAWIDGVGLADGAGVATVEGYRREGVQREDPSKENIVVGDSRIVTGIRLPPFLIMMRPVPK